MPSFIALVRKPGPDFIHAISGHPQKNQIDAKRALIQHKHYVHALEQAGAEVVALAPLKNFPDSPFVEDTAVIFESQALICRMQAKSRQGEVASVAGEIGRHRAIIHLTSPATLDGGDVLMTDEAVYVGQSTRTNREAVQVLQDCCGRPCVSVPVHRGLHLKSSISFLGNNLLVINPKNVDASAFKSFDWITVDESESYAANCLTLGKFVLMPKGYPKVADEIRAHGFHVIELEMGEFEKADGSVTCLSLIIKV
jgi:dimethylargininase